MTLSYSHVVLAALFGDSGSGKCLLVLLRSTSCQRNAWFYSGFLGASVHGAFDEAHIFHVKVYSGNVPYQRNACSLWWVGFAGDDTIRAVFSLIVDCGIFGRYGQEGQLCSAVDRIAILVVLRHLLRRAALSESFSGV